MLDKQSKYVLNILLSLIDEDNYIRNNHEIYSKASKYTKNQVNDSIEHLRNEEYLSVNFADNEPYFLSLSYKGLHYKEFDNIKFKEFIRKSIITPIIVTLITTLIVHAITLLI